MKRMFEAETLSVLLGEKEFVTVEAVSGVDFFGWARVRLSNGEYRFMNRPILGELARIVTHPAVITRLEDKSGYQVTRCSGASTFMTQEQMVEVVKKFQTGAP